jgi:hypothetical protein
MPVVVDLSGNITTNKKHVFRVQVYVQKIVAVRQNLELHPTENVIFTTEVLSE